jgi:hypothetical protein
MNVFAWSRSLLGVGVLGAFCASCTLLVGSFEGPGGTGGKGSAASSGSGGRGSGGSGSGAGGSGATASSASGGGTGGASASAASSSSGAPMCTTDADCAAENTTCMPTTCLKGTCAGNAAASGLTCTESGGKLCDGNGACVACLSSSDCPPTGTSCVSATCSSAGACGTQNAADHASCSDAGGKLCLAGACVVCLTSADCSTGNVCQNHACIGECSDGQQDGTETDVDCGGGSCPTCTAGQKCTQSNDCVSTAACENDVCTTCGSNYDQPCGSCNGVYGCTGTCSIPTPGNFGDACGSCGGTIECDGVTCSVKTPTNLGASCTGVHCTCGGAASGTIGCSGKCVIDTPCSCCGSLPC